MPRIPRRIYAIDLARLGVHDGKHSGLYRWKCPACRHAIEWVIDFRTTEREQWLVAGRACDEVEHHLSVCQPRLEA